MMVADEDSSSQFSRDSSQDTVPHANGNSSANNNNARRPLGVNNRLPPGQSLRKASARNVVAEHSARSLNQPQGAVNALPPSQKQPKENPCDKEIAAVLSKLKRCKTEDAKRQSDLLARLRILMQERVDDQGDHSPLTVCQTKDLGSVVVEVMRNLPEKEEEAILEECTCILYFVSVLDASYKKGIARIFKAMGEHLENVAIQKASLAAIYNIISANPASIPRIAPSLPGLLKTMDKHSSNANVLCSVLQVLGEIALCSETKPFFVSSGALQHVFSAMKQHMENTKLQATSYLTLSALSKDSSSKTKRLMVPAINLIMIGLQTHPKEKDVQLYGIQALGHLLPPAGVTENAVATICHSMKDWPDTASIHEAGCLALCHIVLHCPFDILVGMAVVANGFVTSVVESMNKFQQVLGVQYQGLRALVHLSSRMADNMGKHVEDFRQVHECLLSEGGLDVVLMAMENYGRSHALVAQIGCELLVNVTRNSLDFQRAIWAKGGIELLMACMRTHSKNLRVQDLGCCALRNICLNKDNRKPVQEQGGILTILVTMDVFVTNATIQAYACDALGRLAMEEECRQEMIGAQAIEAAVAAINHHKTHAGVQDRACFMLLNLTNSQEALKQMVEQDVLTIVRECKVPPKKPAMDRWQVLIARLEHAQPTAFGAWFGRGNK